jgi:hypothetical protein
MTTWTKLDVDLRAIALGDCHYDECRDCNCPATWANELGSVRCDWHKVESEMREDYPMVDRPADPNFKPLTSESLARICENVLSRTELERMNARPQLFWGTLTGRKS